MRSLSALLVLVTVAACEGPPGPPGRILEIRADDDTYVNPGDTDIANPHETEILLIVATSGAPSHGFMKWELVGFSDLLTAHLRFEASTPATLAVVEVHGSDDDDWDGDRMAWPGPATAVLLGSVDVQTTGESVFDIDVTTYLVDQLQKGPIGGQNNTEATFAFLAATSGASVGVSSREDSDHRPLLLVLPF